MNPEIFYDERLIRLLDHKPDQEKQDELIIRFGEHTNLPEAIDTFEKDCTVRTLVFWCVRKYAALLRAFQECFRCVEAAGGIVFNEKGEILFIHRNGRWDLPKGKISGKDRRKAGGKEGIECREIFSDQPAGISAEIAAIREISEETGLEHLEISRELSSTWHIYSLEGKRMLKRTWWFRVEGSSGDTLKPQTEEGIVIARWVPVDALACIFAHTWDSLKPLVRKTLAAKDTSIQN